MSYYDTLTTTQKKNAGIIQQEMVNAGITNPLSQAAILAVISKESGFLPIRENGNYSVDSIVRVFKIPRERAAELAHNPEKLFNAVYSNRHGTPANMGFAYRGGGFNQLTFKGNYDLFGKLTNTDLGNRPELIEQPDVAAKVAVQFAKRGIEQLRKSGALKVYNADNINDFKTPRDAMLAFYHVNAGAQKPTSYVIGLYDKSDHLGGMTKMKKYFDSLYNYTSSAVGASIEALKKKPLVTAILTITLIVGGYILVKYLRKSK